MRIKKHPTGNEYLSAGGVWVRNFTKASVPPLQLTHLFGPDDYHLVLKNEELNKNYPKIAGEKIRFRNVVIVSDGYDFDRRHLFLRHLPKGVAILLVNRALSRWKLASPGVPAKERRTVNGFVVNNPYRQSLSALPPPGTNYFPTCIASERTCHEFTKRYGGDVYTYSPTPEATFGFGKAENYFIDDYRNPVCACVGLAYQFRAEKVMLVCCDDSFAEQRESSVALPNGLHTYPHHLKAQDIIDANLRWLTGQEGHAVRVADYSSGREYAHAAYISTEDEALSFFRDQEEGAANVEPTSVASRVQELAGDATRPV